MSDGCPSPATLGRSSTPTSFVSADSDASTAGHGLPTSAADQSLSDANQARRSEDMTSMANADFQGNSISNGSAAGNHNGAQNHADVPTDPVISSSDEPGTTLALSIMPPTQLQVLEALRAYVNSVPVPEIHNAEQFRAVVQRFNGMDLRVSTPDQGREILGELLRVFTNMHNLWKGQSEMFPRLMQIPGMREIGDQLPGCVEFYKDLCEQVLLADVRFQQAASVL